MNSLLILILCICSVVISADEIKHNNNLAFGKKVMYSIKPNKWKDKVGKSILTDGIKHKDGTKSYNNMIGYHGGPSYSILETIGINMCIDLQKEEYLKKTSINLNGHVRFGKPKEITCVVSQDGINFYTVGIKQRLLTYGKATKPFAKTFLTTNYKKGNSLLASEDAVKSYRNQSWQTFTFDLEGIKARYVGFNIKGQGIIFNANEWEIYGADKTNNSINNQIYASTRKFQFTIGHGIAPEDDVFFGPRIDTLYISNNIITPNFCFTLDCRSNGKKAKGGNAPLEFNISLPSGVEIIKTKLLEDHSFKIIKGHGTNRKHYSFVINNKKNTWNKYIEKRHKVGPLYFKTDRKLKANEYASFYCKTKNKTYTAKRVPIAILDIPKVKEELPFLSSITWMYESQSSGWPNFFENYKHLGFNAFPIFPRFYMKYSNDFKIIPQMNNLIKKARANNLKIIYNESPLHLILRGGKDNKDARCQGLKDNQVSWICPSYNGPRYQKEMKRIENISRLIKPDVFMADIEVFSRGIKARKSCSRCQAGLKKSGLSSDEYYTDCGTRIIQDINKAVSAGGTNIKSGLYGCAKGTYHKIFAFDKIYPKYIQLAQASLYEAGNLDVYYKAFKASYENVKQNWISSPWLTGGTYGEIPSHKLEIILYDCVLNGNSVGFYAFSNFDTALDYYYIGKAFANLSQYNHLLKTGKPDSYLGKNPKLFYSCFKNNNQALMNIGNYTASKPEKVLITSPIKGNIIIKDVKSGRILSKKSRTGVEINVAPQESILLSFTRK